MSITFRIKKYIFITHYFKNSKPYSCKIIFMFNLYSPCLFTLIFRIQEPRQVKLKIFFFKVINNGMLKWWSYMILAPATMAKEADPKNAAAKCLKEIELDPESYRIGHTKVWNIPLWSPEILISLSPNQNIIAYIYVNTFPSWKS